MGFTAVWNTSCVLIWNGEKCDQKWFSVIQNGHRKPFCGYKLRIDLKWREMRSKVIFGHPKWPPAAILWEKKSNLRIDLKWREMRSKVIFGHPKWPPAAILWEKKSNLRIDLKWREMRSKVIFGHPKWGEGASQWPACENHSGKYTNSIYILRKPMLHSHAQPTHCAITRTTYIKPDTCV